MAPAQRLILSFGLLILAGAFLLHLPVSQAPGEMTNWVNSLFTATSAVCVTGLIVVDTGSHFSPFGQAVILLLIQLGGLSIITFSLFFLLLAGKRLSLFHRKIIQQGLTGSGWEDFWPILKITIVGSILMELVGAVVLFFPYMKRFHHGGKAIWYSLFHSISAFCNAGFSLHSDSLTGFSGNTLYLVTIMLLVIAGGLGFLVLSELINIRSRRPFSLHTRLVLITTGILIVAGTLLFGFMEWHHALAGKPLSTKILLALFQSVTPRTAGFNAVPMEGLTHGAALLTIWLMFIGGSPGSTAGGIKTTTFGIIIVGAISRLRNREQITFGKRGIGSVTLQRAVVLFLVSLAIVSSAIMVLFLVHPHLNPLHIIFEAFSAFGTVGLSLGTTPLLNVPGRLLVTLIMFVGRLGPLVVGGAFLLRSAPPARRLYPEEEIVVG